MLIAAIGDTHFKIDNIFIVDKLIQELINVLNDNKPDIIVLLGDILHDHERLHTIALNKAYYLINKIREIAPVYILVGNHDMINHDQFLTKQHWMNALKMWDNVIIVDNVIHLSESNLNFMFCPYVAPGRFIEALETIKGEFDWKNSSLIFAHQEFKGCKMGAIISEIGDEWDINSPLVVSGHIHSKQRPQENIVYPGSSMQVAYGENEANIVLLINIDEEKLELEEINLDIPKKRIIYIESSEFDTFTPPNDKDHIKLTIKGSYEDFKTLKKSKKYKLLIKNKNIKISYRHSKVENKYSEKNTSVLNFHDILNKLVKDENNNFLNSTYKKIINK